MGGGLAGLHASLEFARDAAQEPGWLASPGGAKVVQRGERLGGVAVLELDLRACVGHVESEVRRDAGHMLHVELAPGVRRAELDTNERCVVAEMREVEA
jgi:hypothetical protein